MTECKYCGLILHSGDVCNICKMEYSLQKVRIYMTKEGQIVMYDNSINLEDKCQGINSAIIDSRTFVDIVKEQRKMRERYEHDI